MSSDVFSDEEDEKAQFTEYAPWLLQSVPRILAVVTER